MSTSPFRLTLATVALQLCLSSASAFAQQPAADEGVKEVAPGVIEEIIEPEPSYLRRNLRFQRISRERGLPAIAVNNIVQDKTGFIWVATGDGLGRYDGQRFVVFRYDPKDPTSISSSDVIDLMVAKDGTLWVGTLAGLNRYLPATGKFQRFEKSDKPDSLSAGTVLSVAEGADGRIWLGTLNGGLNVLDPATGKIKAYKEGLEVPVVSSVLVDGSTIWCGTAQGVRKFDAQKGAFESPFTNKEPVAEAAISALVRDRDGNLWIGTDGNGLFRYAIERKKLTAFEPNPEKFEALVDGSIKSLFEDAAGLIWIGSNEALHIFDPKTQRFERQLPSVADASALPGHPVQALHQDKNGVMWVGTYSGGLSLIDPLSLRFNRYKTASIGTFFEVGQDLWIGTMEQTCKWRGKFAYEGICYPNITGMALLVDRSGTLWVGTLGQGLYRLDPGSKNRWLRYTNDPENNESLGADTILSLYEDKEGGVWVGSFGGGLQKIDRKNHKFITRYELPTGDIYSIREDPKNPQVIWIGTADRGILRLDMAAGTTTPYMPNPKATDDRRENAIVDVVFESDRILWLSSYGGGLKKLDLQTNTYETYRRANGLPSDNVYGLIRIKSGEIWMSSAGGLVRFDPTKKPLQFEVFTAPDGLQADEFTQWSYYAAKDGRLFFGGFNGFNAFNPADIEVSKQKPPLVLTSVKVLGEPYAAGQEPTALKDLKLGYDEAMVTVEFAALNYSGSESLKFQYQLEGLNDHWFDLDTASVGLTGLDDGKYKLNIRARDRRGAVSDPLSLAVVVSPPLWRTWWAYAAYGLVLFGLFFGIYRYQQNRVARLQKMARLAAVEREFEVTATVQTWFLPEAPQHSSQSCDLVGFYRAADKCSGDWWWYEATNGHNLLVIVADVTGHGAGSAMLTAAVAMGLRVQADSSTDLQEDLRERLIRVNREVRNRCKGQSHMTMTAIILDEHTNEMTVYGLGGLPPLLMGRDGKHRFLTARGVPLGSADDLEIGVRKTRMERGDRLLVTTDGIVETTMPGGRHFGFRRLVNLMRDVGNQPLDHAVNQIIHEVDTVRGRGPQEDDLTFCLIQRR